ncbi:MAG: hypothetical protein M3065_06110 [Actinomycetota bacterium]|nr:hypothetical protein [Actinomycetota bacterium]
MVKLAGAIVVCAAAAFAVAFFAAGAGETSTTHVKVHAKAVRFADAAARSVAVSLAGHPGALKLPAPRHVKHHAKPPPVAITVTTPVPPTTTSAPAPVATAPPPTHKHSGGGGTGTGTTVVVP